MPTLYYTDYSNQDLIQQRILTTFLNIELPLQQIPNRYAPLILVDGNLTLNDPNSISVYLAGESKILGQEFDEEVQVYSWLEYYNIDIYPLVNQIYGQILGKSPANEKKYNYAVEELKRVLGVLDSRLKLRSFFVGNALTLVDIVLCCHLQKAFRLVITPDLRKKLTNLTRWYTYVRSLKPFTDCIGKMFLCENAFKMEFGVGEGGQKQEKVEESTKIEAKLTQKKEEQKPQKQGKKKNEKKKQQTVEGEEKPQKQQTQKQQGKPEQKQGQFSLDNFKRSFQNSENKELVINQLLDNFPEGWSIWKIDYSKDVTQGKVDYLTANLAKGNLQRLENLRKYGFGTWAVLYSQQSKQFQIRGVMIWKGQDIAKDWKEHPSYEYHVFTRLDPNNPEHQKLIKDYWLQNESCQGFELNNSFKLI